MKRVLVIVGLLGSLGCGFTHADTFDGYDCQGDCSGHQAGYDWAEGKGLSDVSQCSTSSNSFNEGCQSFINGGAGQVDEDSDDEEDEE